MVDLRVDCDTVCATLLFSLASYLPDYQQIIVKNLGAALATLTKGINKVLEIPLLVQPQKVKRNEVDQQIQAMRKMLLAMVVFVF